MTTKNLTPHTKYCKTEHSITHYIHISKTLDQLKQTHALLLKTLPKTHHQNYLTQFLFHLLKLSGDNLSYARQVFDKIPNCRNQFLWTSLIRSHVVHTQFSHSIWLYAKMQRLGVLPSGFTFSSVLNACARMPAFLEGKQVQAKVVQLGYFRNKFVITALLDMYAKCGFVLDARRLFDMMDDEDKDLIAWTAMICGYTKMAMMDDAQRLFDSMSQRNVISWTAMVAGYAKCGDMRAAKEFYDRMIEKNSVTWVAMIAGYGKCGDVSEAKRVFDEILEPDASCWAAMVACYAQNGYAEKSIELYKVMREKNERISEVAMVGAISACTQLGDIEMATKLAEHVEQGCCGKFFWLYILSL
ncbi:putative pentatricopeptide repeat-containing protein At5g37570 [Pistacia vera]|uniref:putative pentatricopeptide repeat-containing protein At5g37570 n=1 Tax=Pistacia vera TaxID=55513 RepID=UPI001262B326|nr:putative pentatricopeptide repeat-containing protein At5g37570 [Pistacia vera]